MDARRLLVGLPDDKFLAWKNDLDDFINKGGSTYGELESMVGRLNHASFLIPLS
jgi:hypothetical protein